MSTWCSGGCVAGGRGCGAREGGGRRGKVGLPDLGGGWLPAAVGGEM